MVAKFTVAATLVLLTISGGSYAQPTHPHPEIIQQYELKDGSTLYVFKGGKMGMEDNKGRPHSMKNGRLMETKDGEKLMMYGNELWAVKAHQRSGTSETPDDDPVHQHTRK